MKILITGSTGMVGTALCRRLSYKHDIITPRKHQLNVGNLEQVMKFSNLNPELIVHLAAETDHEWCEENPAQCYLINTVGTMNMTRLAMNRNVPILYLSAGSIFDGESKEPYDTSAYSGVPNPINHYNSSKWYGEILAASWWYKHYVIRAGWMFGGGPGIDKKFVSKIIDKIKTGQKKIMVCDDCIGSPTYTEDLSEAILGLINNPNYFGIMHCVNECGGGVSRWEFARAIVEALGTNDVEIIPCKIDDLKEEFPCKRTNYEVLSNDFSSMRGWREALNDYIAACYRN